MRLIDADALKDMMLQAYNDALPEFDMPWKKKMALSVTLSFMADVDEAPTVDAVPVVRCRECRHRDPEDHKCESGEMERQGCPFPVDDDYFCKYGARREWGDDDE